MFLSVEIQTFRKKNLVLELISVKYLDVAATGVCMAATCTRRDRAPTAVHRSTLALATATDRATSVVLVAFARRIATTLAQPPLPPRPGIGCPGDRPVRTTAPASAAAATVDEPQGNERIQITGHEQMLGSSKMP